MRSSEHRMIPTNQNMLQHLQTDTVERNIFFFLNIQSE